MPLCFDLDTVRYLNVQKLLRGRRDLAQQTAGGNDFIIHRNIGDQRLVLLLALVLKPTNSRFGGTERSATSPPASITAG